MEYSDSFLYYSHFLCNRSHHDLQALILRRISNKFPPSVPSAMHERLAAKIEEFKVMGIQYTFDGFAVADFLTQLDTLAEIKYIEFKGSRLSIWFGELKGTAKDWSDTLPSASLLGTITAGSEDTPQGYKLWFEWMLPKDIHYEKQI